MLSKIRKFSSSVFAKIFLFIVAIPFIFWGMGDLFSGGNKNTIVQIDNEKILTNDFLKYINIYGQEENKLNSNYVDNLLSNFIGAQLIKFEVKKNNIKLSDFALGQIIKNEKFFKRENKFSRTEYEKFLISKGVSAVNFEASISEEERKIQLLNFIAGGIAPSDFLVNSNFNRANQKRNVEIINLDEVANKKFKFSEEQIESYYKKNKNKYTYIYKKIKYLKLNPKNLTGNEEFSDLFFKKLDEIDDLISEGRELNYISNKFNVKIIDSPSFNKSGGILSSDKKIEFSNNIVEKIFKTNISGEAILLQDKDEYFVFEATKSEDIEKEINDKSVRASIIKNLENASKRKFVAEIIKKINDNNFRKKEFDEFIINENTPAKKIKIRNQNDQEILKQDLINQIYIYPEKRVIVVADLGFSETYLVYIDKIENVAIKKDSDDFQKYYNLSRDKMKNSLYNTYDSYLKAKYKIKINYAALNSVKDYFK